MAATDFHLVTEWALTAPAAAVWEALTRPEEWPRWWRAIERVELIEPGDANGVGGYRRFTWRTALPYRVRFRMRVTRAEPMSVIEGWADGELSGVGRWTLTRMAPARTCAMTGTSSSTASGCARLRRSCGRRSHGTTTASWRGATKASRKNWRRTSRVLSSERRAVNRAARYVLPRRT